MRVDHRSARSQSDAMKGSGVLIRPTRILVQLSLAATLLILLKSHFLDEVSARSVSNSGICSTEWLGQRYLYGAEHSTMETSTAPDSIETLADAEDEVARGISLAHSEVVPGGVTQDGQSIIIRPRDPHFLHQRLQLYQAGVTEGWEVSFGSSDTVIAVISDGVDITHPDLVEKIWRNGNEKPGNGLDDDGNGYVDDLIGWDFGGDVGGYLAATGADEFVVPVPDSDPSPIRLGVDRTARIDTANRGTMMAGIAAAESNNSYGVSSVAWNARIMPLKVMFKYLFRDGGWGIGAYTGRVVEAVCYAANHGADVIVMGGLILSDPSSRDEMVNVDRLGAAIRYARSQGSIVIASAGECGEYRVGCPKADIYGDNPTIFPAAFDGVLGVQSVDSSFNTRREASHGTWIDIAAPGQEFMTTVNMENDYEFQMISSSHSRPSDFAAAVVAGSAALLRSVDPTATPLRIEQQLCSTANREVGGQYVTTDGVTRNDYFGCGFLDANNALRYTPWVMRSKITELFQLIDTEAMMPRFRFGYEAINVSFWEIRANNNWLWDEPVQQHVGAPAVRNVVIDLDALRVHNGNRLSSGDRVSTLIRSCPNNRLNTVGDEADDCSINSRSGCSCIKLTVEVVDEVFHIFLPSTAAP